MASRKELQRLVDIQAMDAKLWFPEMEEFTYRYSSAAVHYLQAALRKLAEAVEGLDKEEPRESTSKM